MGKLDGKVAIVTGSSRGIGKAVALMFAAEGAAVVSVARTLNEGDHKLFEGSINSTVSAIRASGGKAVAVQADVSSPDDCAGIVAEARKAFGPIDILVNNAAVTQYLPVKDFPINRWIRYFAVMVHGSFMLSQMVLPDMIQRRSGAIVNLTSMGAIGPGRGPYTTTGDGGTMYGTAKAAIERFSQGLAEEVYQHGISVTAISPSVGVATPGTVYFKLVSGPDDPEAESAELMAKSVLLLATEPVDKVTGRVTYSQAILKEFGWISEGRGYGITIPGSGFSQI